MSDTENFDSLDDTINAALESQRADAGVEPGAEIGVPAPAPRPADPETGDGGRDEQGRFVQKAQDKDGDVKAPEDKEQEPEEDIRAGRDLTRPPKRASIKTKMNWMSHPEEVRDDLLRFEKESHDASKDYAGLEDYAKTATRNGTSLRQAMTDYTGMEDALRRDPILGAIEVWQRMGYNPRQVIGHILSRFSPASQTQASPQTAPQAASIDTSQFITKTDIERQKIEAEIKSFADDEKNMYFADVRPDMARLVTAGIANNLRDAYVAACKLHGVDPSLKDGNAVIQAKSSAAALKARKADKAIGGSPSRGNTNASASSGQRTDRTLSEEIDAAIAAQRGTA